MMKEKMDRGWTGRGLRALIKVRETSHGAEVWGDAHTGISTHDFCA